MARGSSTEVENAPMVEGSSPGDAAATEAKKVRKKGIDDFVKKFKVSKNVLPLWRG
jgi:hypothetical protein